jgi:hypothetical protein
MDFTGLEALNMPSIHSPHVDKLINNMLKTAILKMILNF